MLTVAVQLQGQDFRRTVALDPYLTSVNPAALGSISFTEVSSVEAGFAKDDGGLADISSSDDDFKASVGTESYGRMSDRLAYHGRMSYSYFSGRNMGGSVLMDPYYNPVNFLESSPDNTGTKTREIYAVSGALACTLGPRVSLGAGFSYESADQVKIKDPRFRSRWSDIRFDPGIWFSCGDGWSLGLSAHCRRTLEQVLGGIYGTTDRQYFIYTDKGGFFGSEQELAGDYNYLPSSSQRPMSNSFVGASLQAGHVGRVKFYNELKVLYRTGYYGKKASSSACFFDFAGLDVSYDATAVVRTSESAHVVKLVADLSTVSTIENLFRYVTPSGQMTVVEYYGEEDLSERILCDASLSYDMVRGIESPVPSFEAGASIEGRLCSSEMEWYPFSRSHDHASVCADAYAAKGFGAFSAKVGASFMTGTGTEATDVVAVPATTSMKSFDNYMHRQFEYDTATRAGAALSLRYTRFVSAKASAYIELSDSFTCLLKNPQYLYGRTRNAAVLTVGCSF